MEIKNGLSRPWLAATLLAGSVGLTACGGGGGEDEETSGGGDTFNRDGYISASDRSVGEGNEKAIYEYEIRLSRSQDEAVTVDYETRDGTAKAGEDYDSQSGTVTFAPGSRSATIEIPVLGDVIHEPDEFLEIHLSNVKNAKMNESESKGALTLANDDDRPHVAFESGQQSVSEFVGSTRVTARMSQQSGYTVEAELSMTGTARDGDDFSISDPLTLTFEPGETVVNLDIDILQDNIPEGGETIKFSFDSLKDANFPDDEGPSEHTVIILGDNALNDTGLDTFTDGNSANLTLEPSSHPGQDASFGRDTEYHPDSDGHAGFSYTKLDQDGNPLPSNSPSWDCTRDNTTGLVWENKLSDIDLTPSTDPETGEPVAVEILGDEFRAGNFLYGWRKDNSNDSGGSFGIAESTENQLSRSNPVSEPGADQGYCGYEADSGRRGSVYCNTRVYIEEMNRRGVCGFKDWRMPEIEELRSLANHKVDNGVAAPEPKFFSNLKTDTRYLSDTPAADNEASAWCYDYAEGEVKLCQKGIYRGFMAVRNKQ